MTVFINYLKIQKKHLPTILMYVGICVGVSVLISMVNSSSGSSFVSTESSAAVINRDDSFISEAFAGYVQDNSDVIEIGSTENDMKDAIFERKVDAIFIIPENFGEELMAGKDPQILIRKVPDSTESHFIEMQYNSYMNLLKVYAAAGYTQEETAAAAEKALDNEIRVRLLDEQSADLENLGAYYNFAAYGLMAALIFATGLSMLAFRRRPLLDRTISSGIRGASMDLQILLANSLLSVMVFGAFFVLAALIYRDTVFSAQGLLMSANALVFTLSISAIAFFAGVLIKKREAASGIANVFSLGSAFLCGAFVPQEMLGDSVLKLGRLLPAYWYILSNDQLKTITDIADADLSFYGRNLLILAAFGFVFLAAGLLVEKKSAL